MEIPENKKNNNNKVMKSIENESTEKGFFHSIVRGIVHVSRTLYESCTM